MTSGSSEPAKLASLPCFPVNCPKVLKSNKNNCGVICRDASILHSSPRSLVQVRCRRLSATMFNQWLGNKVEQPHSSHLNMLSGAQRQPGCGVALSWCRADEGNDAAEFPSRGVS